MSWSSIFSSTVFQDILKVVEEAAPIAELADPEIATIGGAVMTIVNAVENHNAAAVPTTTTTKTTTVAS